MGKIEKECPICNKKFIGPSNKIYCSLKCQKQEYKNKKHNKAITNYPLEKICPICNKAFIIASPIHRFQKYCSEQCRQVAKDISANKSYHKRNLENIFDETSIENIDYVVCPICNEKHKQLSILHFKRHNINTTEELYKLYPNIQLTCQKLIDDKLKGDNNPIKKLSIIERKEASPNSIYHYLKIFNGDKEKALQALTEFQIKNHEKCKNAIQGTNIKYYTQKGYSDEQAKIIIKEKYTTNGLNYYIYKYGNELGLLKYKERLNKWLNALPKGLNHSKIADKAISEIVDNNVADTIKTEYLIKLNTKYYIVDLINLKNNKIIEFFGDYWHCNPLKYSGDYLNKNNNKTAIEIWDYDKNKIQQLNDYGYQVLIIWEYDYTHDTNNVIQLAKKFLFEDE